MTQMVMSRASVPLWPRTLPGTHFYGPGTPVSGPRLSASRASGQPAARRDRAPCARTKWRPRGEPACLGCESAVGPPLAVSLVLLTSFRKNPDAFSPADCDASFFGTKRMRMAYVCEHCHSLSFALHTFVASCNSSFFFLPKWNGVIVSTGM